MSKRPTVSVKMTRLEARTRVIQGTGRFVFMVFCIAIGFVVVATAFPQHREVERLETKVRLAKDREMKVKAEVECRQIEYRALREDPAFLEIHARDRLDYYRQGERILRFRDPD